MHGSRNSFQTTAALAERADFLLGDVRVSPATRRLHGPGGTAALEPRVMHLLLALADAGGAVLSREVLGQRVWGGQFVSDDALNRAIAEIRRVARAEAGGSFGIETIPKTGYRLIGALPEPPTVSGPGVDPDPDPRQPLSRRRLIASAAFGLGVAGTVAALRALPGGDEARVAALIAQGEQAMRAALPQSDAQGVGFLREAVMLEPDNAAAWGKLAIALQASLEHALPDDSGGMVRDAETAARRALALDPRQPDALAALALLPPIFGDWFAAERRLRAVLEIDEGNLASLTGLGILLASVGRTREAAGITAHVAELEPLSPGTQFRRAYGQWFLGREGDAERTLDRALQLWPRHPATWNTRLLLLAMTGRPRDARAMLDDAETVPPGLPAPTLDRLRLTMQALDRRAAPDIAAVVTAWRAAAPDSPYAAVNATMYLARLGALDDAIAVLEGYLLGRGPLAVRLGRRSLQPAINDQRWRKTMMIFIRPLTELRADPRFLPLCAKIGLVDYWRAAGIRPDFLGSRALPA